MYAERVSLVCDTTRLGLALVLVRGLGVRAAPPMLSGLGPSALCLITHEYYLRQVLLRRFRIYVLYTPQP